MVQVMKWLGHDGNLASFFQETRKNPEFYDDTEVRWTQTLIYIFLEFHHIFSKETVAMSICTLMRLKIVL